MKKIIVFSLISLTSSILFSQGTKDTALVNAEMSLLMDNYEKTLENIQQQASLIDKDTRWMYLKAMAFENLYMFDSAATTYNKILTIDKKSIEAIRGLARTYTALGKIVNAKTMWEKAINLDSLNRTTRLNYARLLKRENDYNEAIKQYTWLVQSDTCNFSHWEQIGDCAVGLGKVDIAYDAYNNAFYCNPANAPLAAKYLQFMVKSGAPAWIVLPIASIAIEADTSYAPLNRMMGYILYTYNKDYKSAEKWFSKAYDMGDTSRFTTKHLGISLYYNGYFTRASEMMEKAFASDSTDRMLNFVLARSYIDIGERFKALKLLNLNEWLISPDTSELSIIFATRGELHYRAQEYPLAIKNYEKAFELDPLSLQYFFGIGQCYYNQKEWKKALSYFEDFLKRNEEMKTIKNTKARPVTEESQANSYLERIRKELFFLDEKD